MTDAPPSSSNAHAVPRLVNALVTWGGCGRCPKAPGTVGSLAALPFAALIVWSAGPSWGPAVLIAAACCLFVIGWAASETYCRRTGERDPGTIVVDEVAGQWIALAPAALTPLSYGVGFLLFRLFDIVKPFPVGWADRKIHGGLGIMLDDVLAGLYAAVCLWGLELWGLEAYVFRFLSF